MLMIFYNNCFVLCFLFASPVDFFCVNTTIPLFKGRNAVELINRKNTRREAGTDSGMIIRMEYEPELIVRRTTGPVKQIEEQGRS